MRRAVGLTCVLVAILCWSAWANVPPTMADQYVVTTQDTAVDFEVVAKDADIDLLNPQAESLAFTILDGPDHGVLVGWPAEVCYDAPDLAIIDLSYVPSAGFVGTDRLLLAAVDQHGETAAGVTTILIDVTAARDEGLLSGNWSGDLTFDAQTIGFTVFRTKISEVYRVDRLTLTGIADLKMETQGGVKSFIFDALRMVADLSLDTVSIGSTLEFDPDAPGGGIEWFDYWRTTTRFGLLGLNAIHTLYLTRPQTSSYQTFALQGTVAGASVSNTLRLQLDDDCGFLPARNDASLGWSWCDIGLRATFSMTCEGFEKLSLAATGISMPAYGPLPEGITLDSTLTFELESKSFAANLNWSPGDFACVKLMAELGLSTQAFPQGSAKALTHIGIYGVKLECDLFDGVTFVSATSLAPTYNSRVTGLTDYFEVIRISGNLAGCCGIPGTFGFATYFLDSSTWLFDWGMTKLSFDLGLAEQLSLSFELVAHSGELTASLPWTEFSVGWVVRW